jgi:hypothetical protein
MGLGKSAARDYLTRPHQRACFQDINLSLGAAGKKFTRCRKRSFSPTIAVKQPEQNIVGEVDVSRHLKMLAL